LQRLIIDRAEGNPLFAEEIANLLREGGMVRQGTAGLEYDAAAVAAAVPASVQSLLTQRVDRLTPDDRAVLQAASVIGRRFPADLLAAVTGAAEVAARLAVLEEHDLVRRAPGSGEFSFKHALGRDALYASLLSGPRQALHLAIAREIEARNAGRLSEVADVLAHHYARADHKTKAVEYLALVGRRSLGIYSLDEAEYSLRTALEIARSEDPERMDAEIATILVDLTVVYYLQFRSAATIALIEPELKRLDRLGDAPQVAILLDLYGVGLFTSCRFREAKRMADQASRSLSGWATAARWRMPGPASS
jgi:predicted ATPase